MTENLLHLQRWIKWIEEYDDGWHCRVGYTITESREEVVIGIQSTPLAAARYAFKLAKAHYEDRRDNYYLKRGYVETDKKFRVFNVYKHESGGHLLAWTRKGWHCKICDCFYEYLSGDELNCPGVKRYRSWDDIPENLKTPTQLYELGYSKGKTQLPQAEGAIAWKNQYKRRAEWQWVYLYPVEKAIKRIVTNSQEKALKKAHRAKGSTIEIIKEVKNILPSDYTVFSEYKPHEGDWYKNYYTLKISLNGLVVFDEFLSKNKKRAVLRAKHVAQRITKFNDLYRMAESLLDEYDYRFDVDEGISKRYVWIYLHWRDESASHKFETLEQALENIASQLPLMIKELQS